MPITKQINVVDIGSSKIVALIADEYEPNAFSVLGSGVVVSRGIKRGQIIDVNEAAAAIREAVSMAESSSALTMPTATVNISGNHVASQNTSGTVAVGSDKGVTPEDVERSLESAQAITIPTNRDILHVIPRHFKLDDIDGIRMPIGMIGYRLESQANLITAASTAIQNTIKCAQTAQLQVGFSDLVLTSLASAEAVLTPSEREIGVMLVDIGAGTTNIAVFLEGTVWHVSCIPVGGELFTSDLALVLRLPIETAERIKVSFGHANPATMPSDHPLITTTFGDGQRVNLPRRDIAEILNARAEELFQLVMQNMKRSGFDSILPAGIVLTGGGAMLPGMREVAMAVTNLPVRVAQPINLQGMVDHLKSPAFATAIGLIKWSMVDSPSRPTKRRRQFRWDGVKRMLRTLLPGN